MVGFLGLLYSLSGLLLFIIGLLTFTQIDMPLYAPVILSSLGLLVFIKGLFVIHNGNWASSQGLAISKQ